MKIEIDVPDDLTDEESEIIRRGLQEKADEAIARVFQGVNGQVWAQLRKWKAQGVGRAEVFTNAELLAMHFGYDIGSAAHGFAVMMSGYPSDSCDES